MSGKRAKSKPSARAGKQAKPFGENHPAREQVELIMADAMRLRPEQVAALRVTHWMTFNEARALGLQAEAQRNNPLAVGMTRCPFPHAFYVYTAPGKRLFEGVWDARPGPAGKPVTVPLVIRSSADGQPLGLWATSTSMPYYPLAQGDRVFLQMTEARARELTSLALVRCEAENPEWFAKITQKYESREDAIAEAVTQSLEADEPELTHATAGMLEALQRYHAERLSNESANEAIAPQDNVFAPRALESEQLRRVHPYVDALAPLMRATLEDIPPEVALATLEIHRHFDRDGNTVTYPQWIALRTTPPPHGVVLAGERWPFGSENQLSLNLMLEWVGLDFSVLGKRIVMGAMHLSSMMNGEEKLCDWVYQWHADTLEKGLVGWMEVLANKEHALAKLREGSEALEGYAKASDLADIPIERLEEMLSFVERNTGPNPTMRKALEELKVDAAELERHQRAKTNKPS